jgi:ATP-dependent helicase/nuclease subunit A
VNLAPGKLFIVGDPKQSIYAFRRADLEAYDQVVQKVKDSGGVVFELSTNFRSHQKVLEIVNAVFGRVLQPVPNVQPGNVSLMTQPNRIGEVTRPGVELHVVKIGGNSEEAFDSSAATRLEAEQLAGWIKEELLEKARLIDANGRGTPLQPGNIGFLLRKLTQAQDYLDALRRYDIPYVTDGEKHFYRRQEVIDLINLLRVIENPSDTIALIGVLRSPLGALTDQEIYELREREALDYRRGDALDNWASPRLEGVKRLYAVLKDLGRLALTQSIPAIIDVVFSRVPVLELAIASLHREQAVANLMKFRELADRVADRPHLSFNGFIDLLIERLTELPAESEGGAAEESLDAIRVLTVHKAKGLEFPVVILPGLHHGTNLGIGGSMISHDWATGTMGMSIGERGTVGSVLVREKLRIKEEAEQRRVLYVAMTRAKERLILSCGVPDRLPRGSFLGILGEAAEAPIGSSENSEITIGESVLPQTIVSQTDRIPGKKLNSVPGKLNDPPNMDEIWNQWDLRERRWRSANSKKQFLTPTSLLESEYGQGPSGSRGFPSHPHGSVIGTLAHRILEVWDFKRDFGQINEIIERIFQSDGSPNFDQHSGDLQGELLEMFKVFYSSEPYRKLRGATIVGREIPFVIPWDCPEPPNQDIKSRSSVMEGVIDLAYRLDGYWWIADYKTDNIEDGIPTHLATKYETQARIYRNAAAQCLGLTQIGCHLVFIRHGLSIAL